EGAPVEFTGGSPSRWTFEGGVSFLSRGSPNRKGTIGELVNFDTGETFNSVNTRIIDFPFEAGPNLAARYHFDGCRSFDLRWVGLDQWSDTVFLNTDQADPIGTRTPISPFGFVLEQGADLGGIEAKANSYFQSVQAGFTTTVSESENYT